MIRSLGSGHSGESGYAGESGYFGESGTIDVTVLQCYSVVCQLHNRRSLIGTSTLFSSCLPPPPARVLSRYNFLPQYLVVGLTQTQGRVHKKKKGKVWSFAIPKFIEQ